MQYSFTLPADYDMLSLRRRLADAWHLLDDRGGLALKAYLFRARGSDASPVNEYTTFYLWNDPGPMAHFLVGGGGFERIIRGLGRPAVDHWLGIASAAGGGRESGARSASRRLTTIPLDPDPDDTGLALARRIDRECLEIERLAGDDSVHTAALALDPKSWQLVRFVVWAGRVPEAENATERYEVLHLSAPELGRLRRGRHW